MQNCFICKVQLNSQNAYIRNRRGKTDFQSACKSCSNLRRKKWISENKDKELNRRKDYYIKNKEQVKLSTEKNRLKRKYGISKEDYETMYTNQFGSCAICFNMSVKLVIDHCHTSGKVRALLCNQCNKGLGCFSENKETIKNAIEYLKQYSR